MVDRIKQIYNYNEVFCLLLTHTRLNFTCQDFLRLHDCFAEIIYVWPAIIYIYIYFPIIDDSSTNQLLKSNMFLSNVLIRYRRQQSPKDL